MRSKSETCETLEKREGTLSEIRQIRNKQLQSIRQQVEDCKSALEKMERQIIPAYEAGKKFDFQDDDEVNKRSEYLECAFSILREVTGVTRNEQVFDRFLSQKQTKESLENLKTLLENDKKQLEHKKQEMTSELESYRFTDTTEREQKQEEIDALKETIEKERDEYDKIYEEYVRKEQQLTDLMKKIYSICKQIKGVDEVTVPDKCPSKDKYDWLLCILRWKLGKIRNEKKSENRIKKGEERERETTTASKSPNIQIWTSPELRVSDMDEEEEIATRNTLKRQSQLMFEMKSRKKGYKSTVQIKRF